VTEPVADIELADAIAAWINGRSYPEQLSAERVYVAEWDDKDELGELQVGVWTAETSAEAYERDAPLRRARIGVTVAKRVSAVSRQTIDGLLATADAVNKSLELQSFAVTEGNYVHNGDSESVTRGGGASLQRKKTRDGAITYTGHFACITIFDFVLNSADEDD